MTHRARIRQTKQLIDRAPADVVQAIDYIVTLALLYPELLAVPAHEHLDSLPRVIGQTINLLCENKA